MSHDEETVTMLEGDSESGVGASSVSVRKSVSDGGTEITESELRTLTEHPGVLSGDPRSAE